MQGSQDSRDEEYVLMGCNRRVPLLTRSLGWDARQPAPMWTRLVLEDTPRVCSTIRWDGGSLRGRCVLDRALPLRIEDIFQTGHGGG